MLPSGERAKNARSISLPSLWQHYLVAIAPSLDKLENKVQIHHRHVKRFHMVKRLWKSVQYIRRYSTKYAEPRREPAMHFPLGCSPPQARNYWTDLHQKFTRYSGISGAIKSCIYIRRYPIPFLDAKATKVRSLPFFTKSVAMATSLGISKKESRSIICTQNAFIRWKDCENRSSGSWDNLSPRNH